MLCVAVCVLCTVDCLQQKRLSTQYKEPERLTAISNIANTSTWMGYGAIVRLCGVDLIGLASHWQVCTLTVTYLIPVALANCDKSLAL